jgi:hypothetical protein
MHAKYEVVQLSIRDNPFRTRYFCWLDIGLFRDIAGAEPIYANRLSIYLPNGFKNDSVAYAEVNTRDTKLSVKEIIQKNMVWVCGCFFIGEASVLYRWTEEYKVGLC